MAPGGSSAPGPTSTPCAAIPAVSVVAGFKAGSIDAVVPSRLVTMMLLERSLSKTRSVIRATSPGASHSVALEASGLFWSGTACPGVTNVGRTMFESS